MNMNDRPDLTVYMSAESFVRYYYLKEELIRFCRENKLPASGGKEELTERIAYYLNTGKVLDPAPKRRSSVKVDIITGDTVIEEDPVCSEKHRAFFIEKIGKSFSFNVRFQNWLKSNAGKTYADAVEAYYRIKEEAKTQKSVIGRQFEYNTYIRDFFADNPGKSLEDAIKCWKFKKSLEGHDRYERSDLSALTE